MHKRERTIDGRAADSRSRGAAARPRCRAEAAGRRRSADTARGRPSPPTMGGGGGGWWGPLVIPRNSSQCARGIPVIAPLVSRPIRLIEDQSSSISAGRIRRALERRSVTTELAPRLDVGTSLDTATPTCSARSSPSLREEEPRPHHQPRPRRASLFRTPPRHRPHRSHHPHADVINSSKSCRPRDRGRAVRMRTRDKPKK